jgi:hypothetical protein
LDSSLILSPGGNIDDDTLSPDPSKGAALLSGRFGNADDLQVNGFCALSQPHFFLRDPVSRPGQAATTIPLQDANEGDNRL